MVWINPKYRFLLNALSICDCHWLLPIVCKKKLTLCGSRAALTPRGSSNSWIQLVQNELNTNATGKWNMNTKSKHSFRSYVCTMRANIHRHTLQSNLIIKLILHFVFPLLDARQKKDRRVKFNWYLLLI